MARSSCLPCCNPTELARIESSFRDAALQILCAIEENTSGGGGVEANVNVAQWGGVATTLGQKAMAASVPVVIASDQSTLPVTPSTAASWGIFPEDSAHVTADRGVQILGVRQSNTPSVLSDAAGDYTPLAVNDFGAAYVDINSNFRTNGAASVVKVRDAVSNSSDAGVMIIGTVNEQNATLVSTDGDFNTMAVSRRGNTLATLIYDPGVGGGAAAANQAIRSEDTAFGDGGALVMVGAVNNRGITAFNATQGDVTPIAVDDYGRSVNIPFAPINNYVYGNIAPTTATNTQLVAAQGGSIRTYVTNLSISNTGATTSLITITNGSGGAVLWYTIAPAGSGSNIQFTVPLRTTANTALYVTTGSASTTMYISMSGFTAV